MDWFSWLSKTGLDASVVYEYALAFSQNELGQEDLLHFDHEILQSMGISVAKHRLEILKLIRKEKKNVSSPSTIHVPQLLITIRDYFRRRIRKPGELALVPYDSSKVRPSERLITSGRRSPLMMFKRKVFSTPVTGSGRKMVPDCYFDDYWNCSSSVGEFRWDSMFQNLKPT